MRLKTALLPLFTFLLGMTLPALVVWNPAGWGWAEGLTGRLRGTPAQAEKPEEKQLWTCGMHPQVIQDHPGDCPICGMKLVPVNRSAVSPGTVEKKERRIKYWRAPMDPNYISDKPGKSPMGMDLVPVYEDEERAETGVRVDPGFVQSFAIRTARAESGPIPLDTRTIGILDYNQKDIVSINTKFEGWVEKPRVNYIGEAVRKGQVLFEIYSPQLVTTQQEYLAAVDYLQKLESGGSGEDAVQRARSLLEATRERLRYWDVRDGQIEELARSRRVTRTVRMISPVTGLVVEKLSDSLDGVKLTPGMNIYKIADLSTIWAQIEVFEFQIRYLHLGQSARITIDAFPGRRWTGKVIYIDPALSEKTRTLKAFVQIPNPGRELRPQMYADVLLSAPAVKGAVRVPEEAVLHTGERHVVIVRIAEDIFEPREVELGAAGGGYQEIRSGLKAGEEIVTSSQFLIDSESNLKEAISKMRSTDGSETGKASSAAPGHVH